MNVPPVDWEEGPGLIESILEYKWLTVAALLLGAVLAFGWASLQPVRYEGVARVFLRDPLAIGQERPDDVDPARNVRNQAQLLVSARVLEGAADLTGNRVSAKELRERLTVDPERDADFVSVRVLDDTAKGAADLADAVVTAYRRAAARQAQSAAAQTIRELERAQRKLEADGARLDAALRDNPGNPLLRADRTAIEEKLADLAARKFNVSANANLAGTAGGYLEPALIPEEPVQPQRARATAVGALLGLVLGAALSWLLTWRGMHRAEAGRLSWTHEFNEGTAGIRLRPPPEAVKAAKSGLRLGRLQRNRADVSADSNGSNSGIVEFETLNASIQQIFKSLDGDLEQLYKSNVPQLTAEDLARRFQVDHVAVLLETSEGIKVAGIVGLDTNQLNTPGRYDPDLVDDAADTGPRLVDSDEAARLPNGGRQVGGTESLALVPLAYNHSGFGVLLVGRDRSTNDTPPITSKDLQEMDRWAQEVAPYIRSWWLLRHLKGRLGVFE
jgi:hypothetical protein